VDDFGTGNFNVSCWIKTSDIGSGNWAGVVSKYDTGASTGLWIQLNPTNRYVGFGWDGSTYLLSSTSVSNGQWRHISCQRTGASTAEIYVDGVLVASGAGANKNSNSATQLDIGRIAISGRYFNGNIANTKLYNRALTASEIQQNYQATKDKFQGQEIVTNGLVMYLDSADKDSYPGTGTSWDDLTGNENNGTLVNGPSFLSNQNGGVFLFDGVDDYISRAYNSTFNITTGLTLSVTVKRNSIFSQLQDCFFLSRVPSWYFYDEYNSGNIRGEVFIDGVRRGAVQTSLPNDGKYYNIVYTYNSSTGLSAMYKNGSLATSVQLTGLSNYLIDSSTSNFSSLFFSSLGKSYFVGDIKIYNRALSADEVSQNFNAQRTRFGI
jgi:hypothetical protein